MINRTVITENKICFKDFSQSKRRLFDTGHVGFAIMQCDLLYASEPFCIDSNVYSLVSNLSITVKVRVLVG